MKATTLKALKGSIKKWEGIVAGKIGDRGSKNCPLCKLFTEKGIVTCKGCPVADKTGYVACVETPYENFAAEVVTSSYPFPSKPWFADTPARLSAARAELKFLKSLLPKRRKRR